MIEIRITGETAGEALEALTALSVAMIGQPTYAGDSAIALAVWAKAMDEAKTSLADPQPAAAKATRAKASDKPVDQPAPAAEAASLTTTPTASAPAPTAAPAVSAPVETPASPAADLPATEADLVAAANAAAAKLGPSGPAKLKAHIAANFTKADGQPGTLKQTAPGQQAKLLADLQAIGRGELAL